MVEPVEWDVSSAFNLGSQSSTTDTSLRSDSLFTAVDAADVLITYSALSYYVDGSHPSPDGCGGDIVFSAAIVFFT